MTRQMISKEEDAELNRIAAVGKARANAFDQLQEQEQAAQDESASDTEPVAAIVLTVYSNDKATLHIIETMADLTMADITAKCLRGLAAILDKEDAQT